MHPRPGQQLPPQQHAVRPRPPMQPQQHPQQHPQQQPGQTRPPAGGPIGTPQGSVPRPGMPQVRPGAGGPMVGPGRPAGARPPGSGPFGAPQMARQQTMHAPGSGQPRPFAPPAHLQPQPLARQQTMPVMAPKQPPTPQQQHPGQHPGHQGPMGGLNAAMNAMNLRNQPRPQTPPHIQPQPQHMPQQQPMHQPVQPMHQPMQQQPMQAQMSQSPPQQAAAITDTQMRPSRTRRVYMDPNAIAGGSAVPPTGPQPGPPSAHPSQQQPHARPPAYGQQQQPPVGGRSSVGPPGAVGNGTGAAPMARQRYMTHQPTPYRQPQLQPMQPMQPMQQPPAVNTGAPMSPASAGPSPVAAHAGAVAPERPRIDPNLIPYPSAVQEADQRNYDEQSFYSSNRSGVPRASSDFHCVDDGNCNPRFMRVSTYSFPNRSELVEESNIPLSMVIQPLAKLRYDETPIPIVDFGANGPIRCDSCRAYLNVHMTFINGGRKFLCNLCRSENVVPSEYFANLDMSGKRVDIDQRPELKLGTVEYAAGKDFSNRVPQPITYLFAIDVSFNANQNGLVKVCAQTLKDILYGDSSTALPLGARVGIITYDRSIHFYNLSAGLEQATMLVVPDLDDIFVPLSKGLFVDPEESRNVIEGLLDSLPSMFENNKNAEATLGGMMKAAYNALESSGGKLFVFQSNLPTFGPGALTNRDNIKLHGTDKERDLFVPANSFYSNMTEECVNIGVSVNMYLFPTSYIDVASLGVLSTTTAGNLYTYQHFHAERDANKFAGDLKLDMSRRIGYNGVLRIRVSEGLRIVDHVGNMFMRNNTDVELAGIDNDTTIGATLRHDAQLDEKGSVYIQAALLYTTAAGERRIRVHNLALNVTAAIASVIKYADVDVSVTVLTKLAIAEAMGGMSLKEIREQLSNKCVSILASYRRHCAPSSSVGQLILPESFKLFPLYTCALIKSVSLRAGSDVSIDKRVYHMMMLKGLPVASTIVYYYPRIFGVHSLAPDATTPDAYQRIRLPPMTRASYQRLDPAGIFLVENGDTLKLWVGQDCSPQLLQDVFGAQSIQSINAPALHELPLQNSQTSQQIATLIDVLRKYRSRFLSLQVIRQKIDPHEYEFAAMLTEDKQGPEQPDYPSFLVETHGRIRSELQAQMSKNW